MKVHSYYTSGGKDVIIDYINGLSKDEKADGYFVLKEMENGNLDRLHIESWQGKISEVYFYKHNRIFYIMIEQEDIYLLHACKKQKNKTEKTDKEIVLKRAKELEVELKGRLKRCHSKK